MKVKLNLKELLTEWNQMTHQGYDPTYFKRLAILANQIRSEMINLDCKVEVNYCTFGRCGGGNGCSVVLSVEDLKHECWISTESQHYKGLQSKIQDALYGEE